MATSYVLVETYALLQRRLGEEAMRTFTESFAPLLEVVWIDRAVHDAALELIAESGRRGPSLVDASTFVVARQRQTRDVFAFDAHFEQAGFRCL